eukprot:8926423-Prorocentrum_lima.AAC.1
MCGYVSAIADISKQNPGGWPRKNCRNLQTARENGRNPPKSRWVASEELQTYPTWVVAWEELQKSSEVQ